MGVFNIRRFDHSGYDVDDNLFLIHDINTKNTESLYLGTKTALSIFQVVPHVIWMVLSKLVQQLYVIRAALDESAISLVYAFMPSKNEESYIELFQMITDKCNTLGLVLEPVTVMIDFEKAMMNAIHILFGGHVNVKGRFFHLCQSTWRKIQQLGLSQDYIDNAT